MMSIAIVATKPEYTIEDDRLQSVILIHVEGFFDLPTLRDHFAENAAVVKRWRAADRPIRVLINAVDLKPHSPEGQACVQDATGRIYQAGDKVAVLVSSSLVKMQMRRALSRGDILNFFISESAALTWLDVQQDQDRPEAAA
ncbi:hypothetical protein KCP91_17900 [Microvirga sp. SRT01]|uniref:STAS/SEC14 domain-containing protein n=1 Tax=Sphingomonas longa TaxID=2778730 RepID=A0ABS2DBH6_9SPHN|nr:MULTISPECIES: hypothetical protein [Alphaproteobacteria]MBM6578263.1 hypothetical protein [Sphingomonas sp. BT552]MBR7711304.1 hypothetical protein [Microvirga sp. SRT01]